MACGLQKESGAQHRGSAKRFECGVHGALTINGGHCYAIDPRLDREARIRISYELGHGRIEVVAAYIGGRI